MITSSNDNTMKSENTSRHNPGFSPLDAEISSLLEKELPRANSNPWFTPRVMNRLPEKSRWARISIWQWVCYILGVAGFIATGVISSHWLVRTDLSLATIMVVASMSLIAVTCAAVMMVPSLVRILREP